MSHQHKQTDAGRDYATAYETHYGSGDLRSAFTLYRNILSAYPDAKEANYARSQIQHIVNALVPKEKRLESQIELAAAAFEMRVN